MQFRKSVATLLNFGLNEILPPILRDSRVIMYPVFRLAFGDRARIFMDFREKSVSMSHEEYLDAYRATQSCDLKKDSDCGKGSMRLIEESILGSKVLDVGCGRGLLAKALADNYQVTATDVIETNEIDARVRFVKAPAEELPFESGSFDTVICSHVLEHVLDVELVLGELRRVVARRLIILLPIERPYRFGFNLHLRFFPYEFTVMNTIARDKGKSSTVLRRLGDEWMYVEDNSAGL